MFRLLPRKTSLRMRVMVYCAALGGGIGLCLAFVSEHIADLYQKILVNEEMNAELDGQIELHSQHPGDKWLARGAWKSVYIDRPGQPPTSPPALRALPPGVHEVDSDDDSDRFVGIREAPIGRVTIAASLPNSPQRERRFFEELTAMVLLGAVLGAWLGRMLAGGMLAPVLRLSHEVDRADPGAELRGIAEDHRHDEVGALAKAFIRYQGRVNAAIEREILFSADAGHELRTPLTTLQGAVDLLDAQTVQAPARRRIERIRRSAGEIALLLDAMLLVATSDEARDQGEGAVELSGVLAATLSEYRADLEAAQVQLGVRCPPGLTLAAPPKLLRVMLRLLFRALASGSFGQDLRLDADASGVVVAAADAPAPAEPSSVDAVESPSKPTRSDEIEGLGMLRRLCERHGWRLEFGTLQHAWLPLRLLPPGIAERAAT
ncbi:MAG: HAMP domain-containing histidine kinase [Proteobacteria bacterium]|nr:HAMP domain-containing histidine kinase [Pseudomonadota bacterium]